MHVDSKIHERQNIMHIRFDKLLILIENHEDIPQEFIALVVGNNINKVTDNNIQRLSFIGSTHPTFYLV
jgi:hypothetical protein